MLLHTESESDLAAPVVECKAVANNLSIVDGIGRLGKQIAEELSISLDGVAVRIGRTEGTALL